MPATEMKEWVVFMKRPFGCDNSRYAVCTQGEWNVMEKTRPGLLTLVRSHMENEGEAERLARDLQGPGEPIPSGSRRRPRG